MQVYIERTDLDVGLVLLDETDVFVVKIHATAVASSARDGSASA
jgi:hypothetical protein